MNRSNPVRRAIICAATTVGLFLVSIPFGFSQETLRPEIGKPLQAADALIKAKNFNDALAKVRDVDGVPNKTVYETYFIESTRGVAASGAGENDTIIKSFEAVVATGKAPAASQLKVVEALAGAHYRAKDYVATIKWATRYSREGGSNPQIRILLIQAHFQAGDYDGSVKESLADIQAAEKAGLTPSEEKIQILANSYKRQNKEADFAAAVEKWRKYYPKTPRQADGYFSSP